MLPQTNPAAVPKSAPEAHVKSDLLDRSIEDAYTLLNFACRQGLQLDPSASQVIIKSHALKQAKNILTTADETAFWAAFSIVIDRVKPVTVESIVYTTITKRRFLGGRFRTTISLGERALRRSLGVAILTLLVLLALQVEWAIGTTIYNDAHSTRLNGINT